MITAALAGAILRWLVPAVVVVVVTALVVVAVGWAVRAARRSPRARAAAAHAREQAGVDLVTLDDAVAELDLELGLSGALYGGDAPPALRRARMTAQHLRDEAFADFRKLDEPDAMPAAIRQQSEAISRHVGEALAVIARATTEHDAWISANRSASEQVQAARERLDGVRARMGDPDALVAVLRSSFDETEWADAAAAAAAAAAHVDEATVLLQRADVSATDPSRSALGDLALAERRIRAAQADLDRLEEVHRLVTEAEQALPDEIEAAHAAIRQALTAQESLQPHDADLLGAAIGTAQRDLAGIEIQARRRPTAATAALARVREQLDLARGRARSAQQRLHGARTALPGAMAAARSAVARATAAVPGAGADARVRLASAEEELAAARGLSDPIEALDAARRAIRHAEDAQALASYDRMTSGR